MNEGLDYVYLYPENDTDSVHIKLLTGPYENTVFKYGKVKIEEKDDNPYLLFAYDVIECSVSKPKKLEKNKDFKDYIGNLLVEIMTSNLNQEIVDETGTNHFEESDL